MTGKAKPTLKRNDQGLPGWNVYFNGKLKKLTFYPEAECFYFEYEPDTKGR